MKFRTDPKNDVVEGAFGLKYRTVDSLNLNPLPDDAIDLTIGFDNGMATSGMTGTTVRLSREQQIELRKMLTKRLAKPKQDNYIG